MDRRSFDALTQRVARLKTRRSALVALLGGALLLHDPAASDANDKAKRRKKRQRKQARSACHKGITILLDNTVGTKMIPIDPGARCDFSCCAGARPFNVFARSWGRYDNECASAWVFINRYWFQMTNPLVGRPYLGVALGGRWTGSQGNQSCCQGHGFGATVELERPFREGQSRSYTIEGHTFTVTRNRDRQCHKVFTIKLPPTL